MHQTNIPPDVDLDHLGEFRIKAIQESIAGFFNEQVIDSKGGFYFDPTLP